MISKKPNGYWDKSKCNEEALKYKTRSEFREGSHSAYRSALRNLWIEELTKHYEIQGSKYFRFIYSYEFSDKTVYVGLTFNLKKRHSSHNASGAVFNHSNATGIIPKFKKLTPNPVFVEEARILEGSFLQKYILNGWKVLNTVKTGGVGGNNKKWTLDSCRLEALKYTSRSSFERGCGSAYITSLQRGWINDVCSHMVNLKEVAGYWDFKNCKEEALKYNKKTDFNMLSPGASNSASKNNWTELICTHMLELKKKDGYYTIEVCLSLAKECKTFSELKKKYSTAYSKIYKNGWAAQVKENFKL